MIEKLQEGLNKHEQIKNKISEYLLEKHETRNSLLKKQEIIDEINNNFSYDERNELLDYISNLAKNISDHFNNDDQDQILSLLKDLNVWEWFLRLLKMNLYELCATIINETWPHELILPWLLAFGEVKGSLQNCSEIENLENSFRISAASAKGKYEYTFNFNKSKVFRAWNIYYITYSFSYDDKNSWIKTEENTLALYIWRRWFETLNTPTLKHNIPIAWLIMNAGKDNIIQIFFDDDEKRVELTLTRPISQE